MIHRVEIRPKDGFGELLKINAYDQPAVELGKKATFALMGRAGYEDMAAEIAPFAKGDPTHEV